MFGFELFVNSAYVLWQLSTLHFIQKNINFENLCLYLHIYQITDIIP